MSGPDPELLAQYGTDEVYFSNLEKRASKSLGNFYEVNGALHHEFDPEKAPGVYAVMPDIDSDAAKAYKKKVEQEAGWVGSTAPTTEDDHPGAALGKAISRKLDSRNPDRPRYASLKDFILRKPDPRYKPGAPITKIASDSIFGPSTMAVNQGSMGRMIVGDPRHQMEVDRFRAEADAMNIKFRSLESQIMGNTTENLGGPGTRRSAFTRAMMTQPYGVHPLLYAGGQNAVGGFMAPPAAIRPPPAAADVPEGDMSELEAAMDQEMEVQASVSTAMAARIGVKLAQMGMFPAPDAARYMPPPPPQSTAPYVSGMRGRGTLTPMDDDTSITEDLKGAGQDLTTGTMRLGRGVTRAFGKAVDKGGQLFSRMGRGVSDFMMSERQPTPRWGTGTAPARDVNQYGEPIY